MEKMSSRASTSGNKLGSGMVSLEARRVSLLPPCQSRHSTYLIDHVSFCLPYVIASLQLRPRPFVSPWCVVCAHLCFRGQTETPAYVWWGWYLRPMSSSLATGRVEILELCVIFRYYIKFDITPCYGDAH